MIPARNHRAAASCLTPPAAPSTNHATSMDECGSSHDVKKHALNLHSSKEIDLPPTAAAPLARRTARTYRSRRHVVAPNGSRARCRVF